MAIGSMARASVLEMPKNAASALNASGAKKARLKENQKVISNFKKNAHRFGNRETRRRDATDKVSGEIMPGASRITKSTGEVTEIDFTQTDYSASEKLDILREKRDAKLAETDWWASSDLTMTSAQTTYRQALRDITDNATSLDDVTWPTKP